MQWIAHCNTLQHTATHCNTHVPLVVSILSASIQFKNSATSFMFVTSNTLQHTATHCNTLQHTRTVGSVESNTLQHTATSCNTHEPLVVSILSASIQFNSVLVTSASPLCHTPTPTPTRSSYQSRHRHPSMFSVSHTQVCHTHKVRHKWCHTLLRGDAEVTTTLIIGMRWLRLVEWIKR